MTHTKKVEKNLEISCSEVLDVQPRPAPHPTLQPIRFQPEPAGKPVLRIRIRIGSGFKQVRGSGSGFGIRIRIQEGKNYPQK
jgi:hypothetical protein